MPTSCPACGLPTVSAEPNGSCPTCATAWTLDGVTRLTLFTASEGGSPTAFGSVELDGGMLGSYRVLRTLGRGAMGTVMLAEPADGGAPVAIKILIAPGLGTQLSRFVQEGELLRTMSHPNLVRVLEARELSGHPCLVCEYLPGGTLREKLKAAGRFTWPQAARVMDQVLAGLEACHARGIVHRDLKPENVLFDASGNAKVADLGIAKHYGADGPTLTGVGQLIGTPRYMSPEQVRGEPAVVASDVYAAGILLYEMLAGHAPFDGGSVMDILRKHAVAPAPPVPSDVEAPPGVLRMLERALAKPPQDRPPTAADFAQGLRSAGRPSGRTAAPPTPRAGSPRPGSRVTRFALRIALGGLVAAGATLGVYVMTRPDERPLDPHLTVENGDVRVTWRTRSACRGAVTYGEGQWAREDTARTEHGVALTGLEPARRHALSIVTGGGPAWSTALTLPPRGHARMVPENGGVAVHAPACGATAGTLVRETGRGPEPEGPGTLEGEELVFHTKQSAFAFGPGSRVEAAIAPGVTARWPVEDLPALAERLARGLDTFDPGAPMLKLVLSADFDPTLETQAVENFLGTRIAGRRGGMRNKGVFRKKVEELISRQSWSGAFADFRPLADTYFVSDQPLDAKRRLYTGLLKLGWFDLLILSQHDHELVGFAALHRHFLGQLHMLANRPETVDRVVLPGELPLLERTSMFVPRGYVDWMQMRLFLQQEAGWRAATGVGDNPASAELKTAIPSQRTVRVTLPPVPPGHHRRLRARVARMGPMYALTLTCKPTGAPPLEIRLQQPGDPEFLVAMEEPFTSSTRAWVGSAYRYWGEIAIEIPAALLPPGEVEVQVAFQSPPGVPLDRLTRLVRGMGVRELNFSVVE